MSNRIQPDSAMLTRIWRMQHSFVACCSLPLLVRELIEQSTHRRTYVIRVVFTLILAAVFVMLLRTSPAMTSDDPFAMLGAGRHGFDALVMLLFTAIYVLMPAWTCGVITSEKESDTLQLLLITRLGLSRLIAEKLLSRLVPMLMCLLPAIPLAAVCYLFGGFSIGYMLRAGLYLAIAAFQVGSVAVMCSAGCRTTSSAFIHTVVIGFCWMILPIIVTASVVPSSRTLIDLSGSCFLPYLYMIRVTGGGQILSFTPILIGSFVCLAIARIVVWPRAFVQPRSWLRDLQMAGSETFRQMVADFSNRGQQRSTRPEPVDTTWTLGDAPQIWRDRNRSLIGTTTRLLGFGVAGLPVSVFVLVIAMTFSPYKVHHLPGLTILLLSGFFLLVVVVQSSGLIPAEHRRQTLDVLLTTPLASRQIVSDAIRTVHRTIVLQAMILVPLVWLSMELRSYWSTRFTANWNKPFQHHDSLQYAVCWAAMFVLYLPLAMWIGMWVGLQIRNHARGIMVAIAIVFGWMLLPLMARSVLDGWVYPRNHVFLGEVMLSSAVVLLTSIEFAHTWDIPWPPILANFGINLLLLIIVRWNCLNRAAMLLGRMDVRPLAVQDSRIDIARTLQAPRSSRLDGSHPPGQD